MKSASFLEIKEINKIINRKICIKKLESQLAMHLITNCIENDGKAIHVDLSLKLVPKNGEVIVNTQKDTFGRCENGFVYHCGWSDFIEWEKVKDCLIDGNLVVEAHVKVEKITVFGKEIKDDLRCFDESVKKYSDVALVVNEKRFFVQKLFLSSQSDFFASLFMGNFEESKKFEVELRNVDQYDFQNFLEVLYGEPAVYENTVEGILLLGDMYDAQTAVRRCEEFLIEKSTRKLKEKLQMSTRYKMERLKKVCLDQINTVADIREVTPDDPTEMDHLVLGGLLRKVLSLI